MHGPGVDMLEYVAVRVALTHLKRWTVCSLLAYRNGNRCNRRSSSFELVFDAGNVFRKDHRVDMLASWIKVPSALSSKSAVEPECHSHGIIHAPRDSYFYGRRSMALSDQIADQEVLQSRVGDSA